MKNGNMKGKVTVVTGASSGMGAAIAKRFVEAGSKVVLSARRVDRLEKVAAEIKVAGGEALTVPADVADYAQVKKLVDRAVEEYGRIDVMVNAAGFGTLLPLTDTSIEQVDAQIDVNVKGTFYGSKAVLDIMKKIGGGNIINIGSIASVKPFDSFAVYTGAKHAVLGFSKSLYEEVRSDGIRVNVLCPAAVHSEFLDVAGMDEVPWKDEDMIQAEDIAELAFTCVAMPKNVQIESMIIWPTVQATT